MDRRGGGGDSDGDHENGTGHHRAYDQQAVGRKRQRLAEDRRFGESSWYAENPQLSVVLYLAGQAASPTPVEVSHILSSTASMCRCFA